MWKLTQIECSQVSKVHYGKFSYGLGKKWKCYANFSLKSLFQTLEKRSRKLRPHIRLPKLLRRSFFDTFKAKYQCLESLGPESIEKSKNGWKLGKLWQKESKKSCSAKRPPKLLQKLKMFIVKVFQKSNFLMKSNC